ncbi:MAG: hypothetical protein LQ350_008508 [Teloschistes chrysophthalmus]|nr:MAG: hypothetical protein LQ350_008508 [Niorma chrysophthalma]
MVPNNKNGTPKTSRILNYNEQLKDIIKFCESNSEKKASATYACIPASKMRDILQDALESTSAVAMDERLTNLVASSALQQKKIDNILADTASLRTRMTNGSSSGISGFKNVVGWMGKHLHGLLPQPTGDPKNPTAFGGIVQDALRIRVRVGDPVVVRDLRRLSNVPCRERCQRAITNLPGPTIEIVLTIQLKSGDVELQTTTIEDAERIQQHEETWAASFGKGTFVIRDSYTMVIHGIRVASVRSMEDMPCLLLAENAHWMKNSTDIVFCGLLSQPRAKTKAKTSIKVAFASRLDASQACDRGLVWDGHAHSCEVYEAACKLLQCCHCQENGHKGSWWSSIKCVQCAAEHGSRGYPMSRRGICQFS